jgi:hypothetical protein
MLEQQDVDKALPSHAANGGTSLVLAAQAM